ncbi:hypothetical protein Tco_0304328 [Tanacetum coccineum]
MDDSMKEAIVEIVKVTVNKPNTPFTPRNNYFTINSPVLALPLPNSNIASTSNSLKRCNAFTIGRMSHGVGNLEVGNMGDIVYNFKGLTMKFVHDKRRGRRMSTRLISEHTKDTMCFW